MTVLKSKNKTRFFFSLLGPRFEAMNDLMAASLERKFGCHYEPIRVYSAHPNKFFSEGRYVILNSQATAVEKELHEDVIYLQEFEDLNKEFVQSEIIKRITKTLCLHQGPVPVYSFTSAFFLPVDRSWLLLGPDPRVATEFDNKTHHYELFRHLGLPHNPAKIYCNKSALLQAHQATPYYISASFTSGGAESGLIYSRSMLIKFMSQLRSINNNSSFLTARLFRNIVAMPNVNAIIRGINRTEILVVSDQIMRGNHYLGNVYPSSISHRHIVKIKQITKKIGDYLSRHNFRGVFGCDFLINRQGKLVVVDLNPRRQGGYLCNALALKSVGVDLTDLELACVLGEEPKEGLVYDKIQYPAAWAHIKVKPFNIGQQVCLEMKRGNLSDMFNKKRGLYTGLFYTKGSSFIDGYVGHVVSCGRNPRTVEKQVNDMADSMLSDALD